MKSKQIEVGKFYLAKVSGKLTTVRIDRIYENIYNGRSGRRSEQRYNVTNTKTGRKTTFRSAAKFRCEMTIRDVASAKAGVSPHDRIRRMFENSSEQQIRLIALDQGVGEFDVWEMVLKPLLASGEYGEARNILETDYNKVTRENIRPTASDPHGERGMTRGEFVAFLKETLVPDLRALGTNCTADDFEVAIQFIENPFLNWTMHENWRD